MHVYIAGPKVPQVQFNVHLFTFVCVLLLFFITFSSCLHRARDCGIISRANRSTVYASGTVLNKAHGPKEMSDFCKYIHLLLILLSHYLSTHNENRVTTLENYPSRSLGKILSFLVCTRIVITIQGQRQMYINFFSIDLM